jgi:hypothetical protein
MELNAVFARRLYLCWLLKHQERPNVPKLMVATGWSRRTLQDMLKSLPGLGVDVKFIQHGVRNNDGYYHLYDWGPLDGEWIIQHHDVLLNAIELTPETLTDA